MYTTLVVYTICHCHQKLDNKMKLSRRETS